MKKAIRKLKNRIGMSLAETLMAVLILLLVSSVIAAGIPAAVNAYTKAVDAANAYALLSTTVNALRSEFSTAWGVKVIDSNNVVYYSAKTGAKTRLSLDDVPNVPTIVEYVDYDSSGYASSVPDATHPLVETENLDISFSIITPVTQPTDPPVEKVEFGNFVIKKNGTDIAKLARTNGSNLSIIIRLLRPDFVVPELS